MVFCPKVWDMAMCWQRMNNSILFKKIHPKAESHDFPGKNSPVEAVFEGRAYQSTSKSQGPNIDR